MIICIRSFELRASLEKLQPFDAIGFLLKLFSLKEVWLTLKHSILTAPVIKKKKLVILFIIINMCSSASILHVHLPVCMRMASFVLHARHGACCKIISDARSLLIRTGSFLQVRRG